MYHESRFLLDKDEFFDNDCSFARAAAAADASALWEETLDTDPWAIAESVLLSEGGIAFADLVAAPATAERCGLTVDSSSESRLETGRSGFNSSDIVVCCVLTDVGSLVASAIPAAWSNQ